jgi:hypothetical protein
LGAFGSWTGGRKALVSGVAAFALLGGSVAIAIIHQGFPVTDVDLQSQDVWVTNAQQLLGGRLDHQIGELDAKVNGASSHLDVLQDGGATILTDTSLGTAQVIDPAFVSLTQKIQVPIGSQLSYGANTLAVLAPDGRLWVIDTSAQLSFDPTKTAPTAKLGVGSQVVVSKSGTTFAASQTLKKLFTVDHPGAVATSTAFAVPRSFQLSAVGDDPVILSLSANSLLWAGGGSTKLPTKAVRIQQAGPDNAYALVATGESLLQVSVGGGAVTTVSAKITTPVSGTKNVSAPVFLNGCSYGAWSAAQKYLYACDGKAAVAQDIGQPTTGSDLEFRVNHGVIALNNLQNGNAWIVTSNMRLVNNWAQVNPDQITQTGQSGKEQPVKQSFAAALANRTQENHAPVAVADNFGARPGRTTILPVLDNDSDQDGDVLMVSAVDALPASEGKIDVIEGGRALQFTPAGDGTSVSFQYSITDGRGGVASAQVNVAIRPLTSNVAPVATRSSTASVEVGQSVQYNVLADWIDPDGDDIYLVNAAATTADAVQFTPDGMITFTSKTGQTGAKSVSFTVSDGHATATGTLEVDVSPADSLDPVAVPDFAQATTGTPVTISPLGNDLSPSGAALSLVGAKLEFAGDGNVTTDQSKSTISFSSYTAGSYYLVYTIAAGSHTTQGLVLVDVTEPSTSQAPPVAVKDDAYVRPGEPTTVDVLANDVSPSGRVLAVQSVDGGPDTSSLNVELLNNAVVRITAPGVLTQQLQLTYTISDGVKTATAGITVVPIPPLVNHQPPVAVNDTVTVREGDVATAHVLDNDSSPDDEPFTLDPTLTSTASAGTGAVAFVSGSFVRYQAPTVPGTYSVGYGITDKFGGRASATVTFVVTPKGGKNNAPQPTTLTGRAFAGSSVTIDVPLDGIDPDGDSVSLDGIGSSPTKGRITASTATSFDYEAYPTSSGTDTFTYTVEDTLGKTATGTIDIGVIPRPSTAKPPTAVDDRVEIKPGKTAAVPVLANDSDPNGYTISLKKKLVSVQAPLKAHVAGSLVLVTAPATEGGYLVEYSITNGQGGSAPGYIQVVVTKNAKPTYPTAVDQVVGIEDLTGRSTISVNALQGAQNPSGVVGDLAVSVKGPNASAADVQPDGKVVVTPGEHRMAITYSVTDPTTGLSGDAFIIVPPKPGSPDASTAPPHIKSGVDTIVKMNGTISLKLSDIVSVPSGRPIKMTGAGDTAATNSSGQSPYVNAQQLTFTPAKDYRGPAAITFKMNDGKDPGTTADRITLLTLPITVGSPDQSDVPPTFTPPTVEITAGEGSQTIDLRDSTYQPNPAILSQVSYHDFSNSDSDITDSESGSKLTVQTPFGTQPGTTETIEFTVTYKDFSIPGSVNVRVVSSKEPLAQQSAPQARDFKRGTTANSTFSDAVSDTYWTNPFPGHPLIITKASIQSAPAGVTISSTSSSITVNAPSGSTTGNVSIQYTVQDATKDPTRDVIGTMTFTIHDVPDAPTLSNPSADDGQATVTVSAPGDTHGLNVTRYTVTASPGGKTGTATTAGTVTIAGLTNGTGYTFTAVATNSDGDSVASNVTSSVTPYGTPGTPLNANISASSPYSRADLTLTWAAPTNTGGGTDTYEYSVNGGAPVSTTKLTAKLSDQGNGTYSFQVWAINGGGKQSATPATSNSVSLSTAPVTVSIALCRGATGNVNGTDSGSIRHDGVSVSNIEAGTYKIWTTANHNPYSVPSTGSLSLSSYHGSGVLTVHMEGVSNGQTYTSAPTEISTAPPC